MNEELIKQQITGLEAKLTDLEKTKDLFVKVQGIDEEIEKARAAISDLEPDIDTLKEDIDLLKYKKNKAMDDTMEALANKMWEVMPIGRAIFRIDDDGKVFIGMEDNAKTIPYAGLSGGQKVAFDSALSYAMLGTGEKIIIVEGAEMDMTRLYSTLKSIEQNADDQTQYIVNTWIPEEWMDPGDISPKWKMVKL